MLRTSFNIKDFLACREGRYDSLARFDGCGVAGEPSSNLLRAVSALEKQSKQMYPSSGP